MKFIYLFFAVLIIKGCSSTPTEKPKENDYPVISIPVSEKISKDDKIQDTEDEDTWIFTTSILSKDLAIKPNEVCRRFNFYPDFINSKCIRERNSYICKGDIESFLISMYSSQELCQQYLDYARKTLR